MVNTVQKVIDSNKSIRVTCVKCSIMYSWGSRSNEITKLPQYTIFLCSYMHDLPIIMKCRQGVWHANHGVLNEYFLFTCMYQAHRVPGLTWMMLVGVAC